MADERRTSFDADAERYERVRPGYPAALFSDMASISGIADGTRVVEIGAGTGQATEDLLALGATLTCLEPGPALASSVSPYDDESWPVSSPPRRFGGCATIESWLT